MARNLPSILLAVILVATVVSVPASGANREHQLMMADIRMLQEQTQQLQVSIAALAEATKALGAKLDEQANASRRAFADQRLVVDTLSGDIRVVREKIDDSGVRISSLAQDVEAVRLAIQQMPAPAPAEVPPVDETAGTPPGAPPAAAAPSQPAALGMSPERAYRTAWADYTAGQYSLAIEGFESYIRTFPKSEFSGEAQYYIGESHFLQGKFREALAAYDKVIANYPKSPVVPDAYFKRGTAFSAINEPDRARESWEFVVKNFPTTDAGRLARQRLEQPVKKQ